MGKKELLDQIGNVVGRCRKCRLAKTRQHAVPGEGQPGAKILIVGQCPGANEDHEGRPFVGRAGELLNELLRSIGLKREEIFITNIVKCRPPENRDPMVDEVRACKPYLEEQVKTINPSLIIVLGRFAMEHFINQGSITENHGQPMSASGRIILPLYHPAAALRSDRVAQDLRRDFRKIPKILSGELAPRRLDTNGDDNQMALL